MATKGHGATRYVGTNAERIALATDPLTTGTLWIETDTLYIYKWDGVKWQGSGGYVESVTRIDDTDSPYAMLSTDLVIFCDTDGGAIEVDLEAGIDGRHCKLINCGSSGNDLTVDPNGTEELYGEGAGVASTLDDGEVIDIHFDSTEGWY